MKISISEKPCYLPLFFLLNIHQRKWLISENFVIFFFILETNLEASKQIQVPKIFQERPLLTLDYVPGYKSEHQDYGPLSCVPVASQESSIVTDLLYCFIGINGVHVKPVKKGWLFKDQTF